MENQGSHIQRAHALTLEQRTKRRKKRRAEKIQDLTNELGPVIEKFICNGKLPLNQLDNFYGRHPERRCQILTGMQNGLSYSRAYQESEGCFDTKHWRKIANRMASCRGLLLKSTAGLFVPGEALRSQPQFTQLETIALELAAEARRLLREVVHYEFVVAPKPPKKRRSGPTRQISVPDVTFRQALSNLKTARTKLKKNVRDVPQMLEKLGSLPSVDQVAKTAVEVGRILSGVPLLLAALEAEDVPERTDRQAKDLWGIGEEYMPWLAGLAPADDTHKRIATHKRPDADALVSAWLTDRFLFPNDRCQVEFVARNPLSQDDHGYDAVVDMGGQHDPARLVFDHKPPAFPHRDEECAARLVWKHARSLGCPVSGLKSLIELVHDGDAATRRPRSQAYAHSRINGLHAIIAHAKGYAQSDPMLYQGVAAYLDACYLNSN